MWHRPLLHVSYLPIQVLKTSLKITILFWVLVFGFMYLVSVDAKDRSYMSILALATIQQLRIESFFILPTLQNSLLVPGYALYVHGTLFIISLISLLDISIE